MPFSTRPRPARCPSDRRSAGDLPPSPPAPPPPLAGFPPAVPAPFRSRPTQSGILAASPGDLPARCIPDFHPPASAPGLRCDTDARPAGKDVRQTAPPSTPTDADSRAPVHPRPGTTPPPLPAAPAVRIRPSRIPAYWRSDVRSAPARPPLPGAEASTKSWFRWVHKGSTPPPLWSTTAPPTPAPAPRLRTESSVVGFPASLLPTAVARSPALPAL